MKTYNSSFSLARRGQLRSFCLAVAALTALALSGRLEASTIEVQLTGLSLTYDGTDIFDNSVHNTVRAGDPSESVSLASVDFFVDSVAEHTLSSDIFADVYIKDVPNIPLPNPNDSSTVQSGSNNDSFGFDLLTENSIGGWGLALNLNSVSIIYVEAGPAQILFQAALASDAPIQNLPFGYVADTSQPITFTFSGTLSNVSFDPNDSNLVNGFDVNGSATISFQQVPEPATAALACGLGLAAATTLRRRSRRRA